VKLLVFGYPVNGTAARVIGTAEVGGEVFTLMLKRLFSCSDHQALGAERRAAGRGPTNGYAGRLEF